MYSVFQDVDPWSGTVDIHDSIHPSCHSRQPVMGPPARDLQLTQRNLCAPGALYLDRLCLAVERNPYVGTVMIFLDYRRAAMFFAKIFAHQPVSLHCGTETLDRAALGFGQADLDRTRYHVTNASLVLSRLPLSRRWSARSLAHARFDCLVDSSSSGSSINSNVPTPTRQAFGSLPLITESPMPVPSRAMLQFDGTVLMVLGA